MAGVRTYIGLGANLGQPAQQLHRAFEALSHLPGTHLLARSPLYRSPPMGPADQPDYVNAVAEMDTMLAPEALLAALQQIEFRHGRVRDAQRWGPRPLDLDILLYGDAVIATAALSVPHPGLPQRAFVLYPLADIAPELVVPGFGRVKELRARVAPAGIELLGEAADE